MLLPPNPIIHKSFEFEELTLEQTFEITIDEKGAKIHPFLFDVYINERINRPDVYDEEKKQAIVCYPIYGWSFGQITLRDVSSYKVKLLTTTKDVNREVIDGGHRIRALDEFIKGDFPTSAAMHSVHINGTAYAVANKFYNQLDEPVQKKFLVYKMVFMIYDKSLSDFEAGIVFNWQNKMSSLNDIERFNSIQTMVANYIRERSRVLDDGLTNKSGFNEKHKLFGTHIVPNKHFQFGTVIKEEDSRLRFQYILSQIVFWYSYLNDDNNRPISSYNLEDNKKVRSYNWDQINMFLNDETELWKAKQKIRIGSIEKILNELFEVCSSFNNLSDTQSNFLLLRFFYTILHELRCKFGRNDVKIDSNKFGLFLNKVVSELSTGPLLKQSDYAGPNSVSTTEDIAIKLLFRQAKSMDFIRNIQTLSIAKDGSETFKSAFGKDVENFTDIDFELLQNFGVTITPKTSPNKSDKKEMYVNQGQSCAVDNGFCKIADMDYAHVEEPRVSGIGGGAITSKDTNKLVWRKWNNMMSGLTIEEFKQSKMYQSNKHLKEERLQSYNL
jgi:hypothetical protein|tara:strand:- start:105 stop:1769 length:1665 start_codon:yes stop_codon:yes gene_type:complete